MRRAPHQFGAGNSLTMPCQWEGDLNAHLQELNVTTNIFNIIYEQGEAELDTNLIQTTSLADMGSGMFRLPKVGAGSFKIGFYNMSRLSPYHGTGLYSPTQNVSRRREKFRCRTGLHRWTSGSCLTPARSLLAGRLTSGRWRR